MEDFFLKNSKEMSNENLSMRKAALAAMAGAMKEKIPELELRGTRVQNIKITTFVPATRFLDHSNCASESFPTMYRSRGCLWVAHNAMSQLLGCAEPSGRTAACWTSDESHLKGQPDRGLRTSSCDE